MEAGNTQVLTATVSPSNAGNTALSWSSSDTNILTVDQNGLVTAIDVGQGTITMTTLMEVSQRRA